MTQGSDTIFALSSGHPPSGVAVIRLSGPGSRFALETIAAGLPPARLASLRKLTDPRSAAEIDRGLVIWFPAPASFTGEDCAEFHVHGGVAVVAAMLAALAGLPGLRMAQAGEFSRRAFENGRLDLTELEGLADLVAAQTEVQRRQAVAQAGGALRRKLEAWRERIIAMRASVEADFDFADEDGVPDDVSAGVWGKAGELGAEMRRFLEDGNAGEIIRSGFQIVLMGPPNSGKSSLLNALARRDAAIVSPEAGTTRDIVEVSLDLAGFKVVLVDTAGIRETQGLVEQEGMRRARERARAADLVIWLTPINDANDAPEPGLASPVLQVRSKDDSGALREGSVSVVRQSGLDWLIGEITRQVSSKGLAIESAAVTRARHRESLLSCAGLLEEAAGSHTLAPEVRSELLRSAGDEIGRITGKVDVEDLLDRIFSEFCIGK
ncbi:MAG TPA: tRNA uridine-5-carboxymethylaminomethyl(34) synthesis GTPase MnmE [Rhizobiaceae bacterium]|nr:tRNA uridine-5-carboxymethylaminomethyl(34) synthesis GTPase MnmE [Rhizobiaceae bacterium]